MELIVLIKQVPGTSDVRIDPKRGTLIREGIPSIINPYDLHALEVGLSLRDAFGGKITAISMGPPQVIDALQEVIAMGVDEAILLTDPALGGADTLATAYTLGKCIEKIGKYDLIICGMQAIDGDTGQVGPQVAEYLDIPQITYVQSIRIKQGNGSPLFTTPQKVGSRQGRDYLQPYKLVAERVTEDGYEKIECEMPSLITVVKEINKPRYPTIQGIIDACTEHANIKIWNAGDIGAIADKTGLAGSPTQVKQIFTPEHKRKSELLSGDKATIAKTLLDRLKGKKII